MDRIFKLITIMTVILVWSVSAFAQNDTLKKRILFPNALSDDGDSGIKMDNDVKEAADADMWLTKLKSCYYAGQYDDVLWRADYIYNNFHTNKIQKLMRLKYTVAAYKDLEYRSKADSVAKLYLQDNPFYKANVEDPVSFREVVSNYYTKPKFSLWAAAGEIMAKPRLDTVRTIVDTVSRTPEYKIGGFTAQLGFEYRLLKIVSVCIAPTLNRYTMERKIERTVIATARYNETSTVFALPVWLEVGWYTKREFFVPSLYAGAQLKYVISSKYNAYTEARGNYTEIPDKKSDNDSKNRLNYSVLGGVRLNYNRRRITYFADIGVSYDLKPYNDPKTKYSNNELLYQNLYVPDMFKMIDMYYRFGIKVNLQYKTIAKYGYGY